MSEPFYLSVTGTPAPQGSKHAFIRKGTNTVVMLESSKRVKPWRQDVADAARKFVEENPSSRMMTGPLEMRVTYYLKRPQKHFRKSKGEFILRDDAPEFVGVKPDLSKLQRSTEDALTGIAYADDSQLAAMTLVKKYGKFPGAEIRIMRLESNG